MPQEFEGDLGEAVFWGADLHGATFRDVDLTGTRISHALVVDVEIDAMVERLVVNGVDVTSYVNEHDPWFPLRGMLRPTEPDAIRAAWAETESRWSAAIDRAGELTEAQRQMQVDGEFSFVQTLRHLVFAFDKWWTVPAQSGSFHAIGLPNTGSLGVPFPGVELASSPSFDEALTVWRDRVGLIRESFATLASDDLARTVTIEENGEVPLRESVFTVLEEAFWHLRYAMRDLEVVEAGSTST